MITGLVKYAIVLIGVLLSSSAFAVSKVEVESQFETWLANDLWPEAKSKGISKTVFDQAFSGVSLNFELPDLVMPGEKPQTPKKQT